MSWVLQSILSHLRVVRWISMTTQLKKHIRYLHMSKRAFMIALIICSELIMVILGLGAYDLKGAQAQELAGTTVQAGLTANAMIDDGEVGGESSSALLDGQSSLVDARFAAVVAGSDDDMNAAERADLGGDKGFLPTEVDTSQAAHVTISRLSSADVDLDGSLVTFMGEVVGEPVSITGGRKWVQLQSADGSTILVEMSDASASIIKNWKRYGVKGSTLRVTGIYHVADSDNYGDMDVAAYDVSLIDAGGARSIDVDTSLLGAAVVSVVIAAVLIGINVYIRVRNR